jgi:hypothetical protein
MQTFFALCCNAKVFADWAQVMQTQRFSVVLKNVARGFTLLY